jgi:hypothetical protein
MSFKVKITSGTGHDDLDAENEAGAEFPEFIEFTTGAERNAFLRGVCLAQERLAGWIDAWIETEEV